MYRRTKFVEILLEIRQEIAQEADYDVDLFAERVRNGDATTHQSKPKRLTAAGRRRKHADEAISETEPVSR